MNFYETQMGHRFFEHQLPQLIKSLQTISESLDKPAPVTKLPVEPDSEFLTSLYYGNYQPEIFVRDAHSPVLEAETAKAYKALTASLSMREQELLNEYHDALAAQSSEDLALAYQSGVHVAVQMILSGLNVPNLYASKGRPGWPELNQYEEGHFTLWKENGDPEECSSYEVIFDTPDGTRYYCDVEGADSMLEALGLFYREHPHITYEMIIDHLEI